MITRKKFYNNSESKSNSISVFESILGYLILVLLAVISAGVYWKQLGFNPAVQALEQIRKTPQMEIAQETPDSPFPMVPPDVFSILSPGETFDKITLSDKINGKAELYLPSGFQNLYAQRLTPRDHGDIWYEVFIYDMGAMLNAFSVYGAQRRGDAVPETLGEFAYGTDNAFFLVHGPYYVEIIASEVSGHTREHLLSLAEAFIVQNPTEAETIGEIDLFPEENLVRHSIRFIPANAFGFENMDRIFTAKYLLGDDEFTAFISRRISPEEAMQKAGEFFESLITYGGSDFSLKSGEINGPEIKMVDFFGTFEAILIVGPYLVGVHEAANQENAIKQVQAIYEKLQHK